MMLRKAIYLFLFLAASLASHAQINMYVGGNLQANYSWIRGGDASSEPGFGVGVSFIYWEYEYWFLKAGIDYTHLSSTMLDYPDDFGIVPEDENDKINISYSEHDIGIPLTIYFRPYEWGANTLLIAGTLKPIFVAGLKESSEEYGEIVLKGTEMDTRIKTNVGIGLGYQRQLDKQMFLNIVPSYNIDLRGYKSFNSLTLSIELIFGIY